MILQQILWTWFEIYEKSPNFKDLKNIRQIIK